MWLSEARASDCQIWITIQGTAGWNIYFSAKTTSEVFSCCRMVVFGACAQDAHKGASDGQRTPPAWVTSTRWVTWRLGAGSFFEDSDSILSSPD